MKGNKAAAVRRVLAGLLAAVFLFAMGKIVSQLSAEREAKKQFDALAAMVRSAEPQPAPKQPAPSGEQTDDTAQEPLAQYELLYEKNRDLFGWIRIEDTPVDYPVMYTPEDPEYYLRRGFDGQPLACGVPFIDGACPPDGNYYLIHGHHMKNGTMFGTLPRYSKRSYWQAHRLLTFDTRYESRTYEIMAAFYSSVGDGEDGGFRYYDFTDLTDPKRFELFLDGVHAAALYDTGIAAAPGDELIALSTCNYHTEDGRFVVVAKRIE